MTLFGFGKKRDVTKDPFCCRNIESVEVLGAGCKSCHALFNAAKEAAKNLGLRCEVEYITDMEKIVSYGVTRLPALVVNKKVVSMGKVLKTGEVEKLLRG